MKRLWPAACFLFFLLLLVPAVSGWSTTPSISSLSPSSWPNNSVATFTIHGANLQNVTWVRMNKCPQHTSPGPYQADFYGSILSRSPSALTVSFDLTSKPTGQYDIYARAPGPFAGIEDDIGYQFTFFTVYGAGTTTTYPTSATTSAGTTETTTVTTATPAEGENSVFFESTPADAEVWMDGNYIGKTPFTYYTDRDGTYDIVLKEKGYEDYEARVTILKEKRVHFSGILDAKISPSDTTAASTTAPRSTAATGKPAAGTSLKSTIKVPTPWGPDPTYAEESPVSPAIAPIALAIGFVFFVLRRR